MSDFTTDQLLASGADYPQRAGAGPSAAAPSRQVAVLACMDARIDVYRIFGLEPGEAHVLRNAGGVVTDDVLRSLAISQRKLGTREVLVVQHTSCGMQTFDDETFAAELHAGTGQRPAWSAGAFGDLEASVRAGLAKLRSDPFLLHTDRVRGCIYDVTTRSVRPVTE